jgi:hypothetical protein
VLDVIRCHAAPVSAHRDTPPPLQLLYGCAIGVVYRPSLWE